MKTTPFSLAVCAAFLGSAALQAHASESAALCHNIVKADIVAFEQAFLVNRFSAFVPAGVMYALKSDVVSTAVERHVERTPGLLVPGQVRLREDKRPRPLVLRVDKGDCLQVTFTNLLSPVRTEEGGLPPANGGKLPAFHRPPTDGVAENVLVPAAKVSVDAPKTRSASFHVTGLSVLPIAPADCPLDAVCGGDGSNVGLPGQQGVVFNPATSQATKDAFKNMGSLAAPGRTHVALWRADSEGAFFAHSNGATVGGEGDGGQISQGLFGAVMVEPENSRWFRSQVTHRELRDAAGPDAPGSHRYGRLDYGKFAMLDANNNIIHSDLNAIVVPDESKTGPNTEYCKGGHSTNSCGKPYREFSVIFHDEVEVEQAYPELAAEDNPLAQVRDNMGVNYGVSSMGSAVMGTAAFKKVGPAKNCPECRGEEFFLTSWANGDPALILSYDDAGKPNGAQYPDDPSNVHHSYLGDPVRFRNLHAGPKETHVFHLHDHQWVQDMANPHASYLDSQTISPGASFSYDIAFG